LSSPSTAHDTSDGVCMNTDVLHGRSSSLEAVAISKQTAYDYFFASLSMAIIDTQEALLDDVNTLRFPALFQQHADLQRLLIALDEIYQVVPDEQP
jgi:hypothetical protein